MIQRNLFYRQTNDQKPRSLAASQIVCKNGYKVLIPETCFYKTTGLPKRSVLRHLLGAWDKEQVEYLAKHFGATVLSELTSEKGA